MSFPHNRPRERNLIKIAPIHDRHTLLLHCFKLYSVFGNTWCAHLYKRCAGLRCRSDSGVYRGSPIPYKAQWALLARLPPIIDVPTCVIKNKEKTKSMNLPEPNIGQSITASRVSIVIIFLGQTCVHWIITFTMLVAWCSL